MPEKILQSHKLPKRPATAEGEITLSEWGEGEWVTHFHNLEVDGFFYGHYFLDYQEALDDYEQRIIQFSR
jgi:hypothetical protein